jgi:hypothetical protein
MQLPDPLLLSALLLPAATIGGDGQHPQHVVSATGQRIVFIFGLVAPPLCICNLSRLRLLIFGDCSVPHIICAAACSPAVACLYCCLSPCFLLQLLSEVMGSIPNTSSVRLVNASVRGRDATKLAAALLQCGSLRTLQLHQVCTFHVDLYCFVLYCFVMLKGMLLQPHSSCAAAV